MIFTPPERKPSPVQTGGGDYPERGNQTTKNRRKERENRMKKLNELTPEEVKNLLTVNKWFRDQAQEYAQESTNIFVSDILRPFRDVRGIDYNIGYPGNYFTVSQEYYKEFLTVCEEHPEKDWIFGDILNNAIERAGNRIYFFEDCLFGYNDISEKNWEHLEKWIDGIVEKAARAIVHACNEEEAAAYTDETIEENAFCFCDTYGDQYETDGKVIYETTCRQYA